MNSIEEAENLLKTQKITMVFSEFEIEKQNCLPLFQYMIEKNSSKDRMLILVTKNSQQSAVAEAMEEQVDGYIIKPFVINYVKDNLAQGYSIFSYNYLKRQENIFKYIKENIK